ncbi:uncharacterized protein LOC109200053 [Oreochromis niloticus]|uniref:uncharacterized protein LOC109200053 n=1 Tax=Oreochromis niloticus TaxID=8128 RepID=UPI000905A91C|nr:uncharacterized protein LOC109200053 [Oreochromis niloticus]
MSRLRKYHRSKNPPTERKFLLNHSYGTQWQIDHQYASPGAKWQKDLDPLQSSLQNHMNLGGICFGPKPTSRKTPRVGRQSLPEDFWSLGLEQSMESTIGNAFLKIVGEAAQRRNLSCWEKIFTLLTSMSWPPGRIHKSTCCVACQHGQRFAFWTEEAFSSREHSSACLQGTNGNLLQAFTKSNQTVTSMCPHRHIGRHLQTGSGVLHVQTPCVY